MARKSTTNTTAATAIGAATAITAVVMQRGLPLLHHMCKGDASGGGTLTSPIWMATSQPCEGREALGGVLVRREALLIRVEVGDLRLGPVAAGP